MKSILKNLITNFSILSNLDEIENGYSTKSHTIKF